jgi:glycosyltransferase domain-containing protein
MKNLITIVVPTFNRPLFICRSVRYWSNFGSNVIVADGSPINQTTLTPQVSQYIWEPDLSMVQRWYLALKSVETKYVLFCADDDFIGFDAIIYCLKFLENNPEYSCAQGCYLGFNSKSGEKIDVWKMYEGIEDYPLYSGASSDRITKSFRYYFHTMYGIQKTDNVIKFLSDFPQLSNDNAFEMQFTFGNSLFGNHKIFPFLYGVREHIPGSAGSITPNITQWKKIDFASFNNWKTYCSELISQTQGINDKDSNDLFDKAFYAYECFINEHPLYKQVGIRNKILPTLKNLLRQYLPAKLVAKIRERNVEKRSGMQPDLVQLTRSVYGESSVPDAMRIQQAI